MIWRSVTHIPDLTTLKKHMLNSTLVALDVVPHVPCTQPYPYLNRILPARIKTPRALSTHFAAYNPTAVLINSRAASLKGVRVWWICLPTKDLLDKLTADIDGSIMDGKQLSVENVVASWMTEQHGRHQDVEEESVCGVGS